MTVIQNESITNVKNDVAQECVNKIIVRWVSVEDIENAEKRINHLENKIKEAQDILASSLNVAWAFIALDDAIGKTD